MDARNWAARNVAATLLAGSWTPPALAAGVDAVLGPGSRRVRAALVADLIDLDGSAYLPAPDRLAAYLYESRHFTVPRPKQIAACLDSPRFRCPGHPTPGNSRCARRLARSLDRTARLAGR